MTSIMVAAGAGAIVPATVHAGGAGLTASDAARFDGAVSLAILATFGFGFAPIVAVEGAMRIMARRRSGASSGLAARPRDRWAVGGIAAAYLVVVAVYLMSAHVWPVGVLSTESGAFVVLPANAARWAIVALTAGCLALMLGRLLAAATRPPTAATPPAG